MLYQVSDKSKIVSILLHTKCHRQDVQAMFLGYINYVNVALCVHYKHPLQ